MEISFRNRRMEREFRTARDLRRRYGPRLARAIGERIRVFVRADTLAQIPRTPPERLHRLEGGRQEQYAVDLVHPYRLIFLIAHDPVPVRDNGGIDLEQVTAITIVEIVDYH